MGKYFGTDGVRGVANTELTPELAYKLGRFGGYVLRGHKEDGEKTTVVVGRDTRISGEMLESALVAGLLSIGAEVMRLGVVSTPGVAYLTRDQDADAGVMISASHNPFADNGIKFFGPDGFKLSDDQEQEIEELLDKEVDDLPRPTADGLGNKTNFYEGSQKYIGFLKSTVDEDLEGMRIAIDGAHGSTYSLAPYLFGDLEADTVTVGCNPNGTNINDGVGSTHPERLVELVKEEECDLGLAFDGDGDRLIAVDEKGNIVDGDKIMFILAQHLKEEDSLKDDMVVSTVMSNLGFYKALAKEGLKSDKTKVGDRYVVEEMRKGGYSLGGEQSGHIIMMDYNTTGDGLLSGVQLAAIVKKSDKKLSQLAAQVETFPQELVNVRVKDKYNVVNNSQVAEVISEVEKEMDGNGRVLVRASGTEPLVRVMVEAETEELAEKYSKDIAEVVKREMGLD
jgi:phosphoglucosamine mutase